MDHINKDERCREILSVKQIEALCRPDKSNVKQSKQQNNQHQQQQSQQRVAPPNVRSIQDFVQLITCKLCKGYLIDAVTLDICMHTFCRKCAILHIRGNIDQNNRPKLESEEAEKPRCPECNIEIREKRFLNRLKSDILTQSLVYKFVPGLYEREMARRREFYANDQKKREKHEMFGDIPPSKTIEPDDLLPVTFTLKKDENQVKQVKRYFHCRADSTMLVLKKLVISKFRLKPPIKIYYKHLEIFFDQTTLMDVAALFEWNPKAEDAILSLIFREGENDEQKPPPPISSSPPTNSDPVPLSDPSENPC